MLDVIRIIHWSGDGGSGGGGGGSGGGVGLFVGLVDRCWLFLFCVKWKVEEGRRERQRGRGEIKRGREEERREGDGR